jgi:hypothetical protein
MAIRPNSVVDFGGPLLSPGSGRGISESVDWKEFGELGRNVHNEGFAKRVPGEDKCTVSYSCDDDWTTPSFFNARRLTEFTIKLIKPWVEHALPGVTSVTLERTPWSDDDIVVYLSDKTILPKSAWSRIGRVITIPLDAQRTTFIEYRPKITAFLTGKNHSSGEWSQKVSWSLAFEEK